MFNYTQSTILHDIHVVGCGGTGSRLVPQLTQFISTMMAGRTIHGYLSTPKIYLWDFDDLETKNLTRQNFAPSDVGKNKASVLAQRYGKVYDVELIPVRVRIEADIPKTLKNIKDTEGWDLATHANQIMLIMCVDTAQARRDILNFFAGILPEDSSRNLYSFVIDAGNEDNFGQVKFFNFVNGFSATTMLPRIVPDWFRMEEASVPTPIIPIDLEYYANLKEGEVKTSCADLDQTLAINSQMASMIMGVVQNYYFGKPMNFNQVSYSLSGATSVTNMTLREMYKVCINNNKAKTLVAVPSSFNMSKVLSDYMLKSAKLSDVIYAAEKVERDKREADLQKKIDIAVKAAVKVKEAELREAFKSEAPALILPDSVAAFKATTAKEEDQEIYKSMAESATPAKRKLAKAKPTVYEMVEELDSTERNGLC